MTIWIYQIVLDVMGAFVGKDSPKATTWLASICANVTLLLLSLNQMLLSNKVLLKLLQPPEKLAKSLSRLVTQNQTVSITRNSSNHALASQIKIKSTTGCEESPKCRRQEIGSAINQQEKTPTNN